MRALDLAMVMAVMLTGAAAVGAAGYSLGRRSANRGSWKLEPPVDDADGSPAAGAPGSTGAAETAAPEHPVRLPRAIGARPADTPRVIRRIRSH